MPTTITAPIDLSQPRSLAAGRFWTIVPWAAIPLLIAALTLALAVTSPAFVAALDAASQVGAL